MKSSRSLRINLLLRIRQGMVKVTVNGKLRNKNTN
jgi:hypothetical protein